MNYESKNLWNYSKYSCSKGSVGFTSVCFAVGVLSISPVSLPDVQNGMEQLSQAGTPLFWEPWLWHQGGQAVPAASQQDWQQQDSAIPTSLPHSDTNWEPLFSLPASASTPHSAPVCFQPFLYTVDLALAHSPASHALQAENKLNLQPLTTPIHVPFTPLRILSSTFRPAFIPLHNPEITPSKLWKFGLLKIIIPLEIGNIIEKYSQLLIFALAVLC